MKLTLFAALSTIIASTAMATNDIIYPDAPQADITDTYFGMTVADPYRPLENDNADDTRLWVAQERELTDKYLGDIPFRDRVRHEIANFQNYRKRSLPWRGNDGRIYYYENSGLKNQASLYRGDGQLFLDPNTLSENGTVALTGVYMSPSGKYTAYTISRDGSDWTEIYLLDTETGQLLDDHIEWAKFTGAVWDGDDGFYYSAYDRPTEGKEFSNSNENQRIYYHRIGTPQSADTIFFEDPAHPYHFHRLYIPKGQPLAFLYIGGQGFGQAIAMKRLDSTNAGWQVLQANQDDVTNIIKVKDDKVYFVTSAGAPNSRIMSTPVDSLDAPNWVELIPQRDDAVIDNAEIVGEHIVVHYKKDASSRLHIFDIDGKFINEIELPTYGSVELSCDDDNNALFYSFTSYLYPWQHYSYDFDTHQSTMIDSADIPGFNPDDYVTDEIFYPSADGTTVHMFVTRHRDMPLDGNNPVYLYGYGGFNIGLAPKFSPNRLIWLENGGVYAETNLRGGSEYGNQWHSAGTKLNKLNVFNDFISAAEYLVANGYTNPGRIVIEGGSNGGLLVGATVNMRPDLFAVAIPRVGVMDMMRYHLFTIGWNWASDYGTSADSPEMAEYLLNYSPIHNISDNGTPYPAIMVTTADHDDRVVPAHSFKYAATLQAADTGDAPKLIRIDSNAGHGAGKPVSKIIDEQTDIYSFIFKNLNIDPVTPVTATEPE